VPTIREGLLLTTTTAAVAPAAGSDAEPERGCAEHEHLEKLLDLHRFSSLGEAVCVPFPFETRTVAGRCGNVAIVIFMSGGTSVSQ
jgi:hypothetical protein